MFKLSVHTYFTLHLERVLLVRCFRQRRCRSAALGTGKTLALYNFNVESCFLQLFDVAVFTIALGMI